jgi:hypothetical protein
MTRQTVLRGVLVLWLVLIPAGLAFGNSGAPFELVLYVPGLVVLSPLLGLPVTLAAAVLERPFVSCAGIRRHALTRSMRANLLSWLLGLVIMFFGGFAGYLAAHLFSESVFFPYVLGLVEIAYFVLAIPISIVIEGSYYNSVLYHNGGVVRWRWVIAANIFSNAVLVAMAFVPGILRENHPKLVRNVEPHLETVWWLLAAMCLVLVAFAFRPLREPLQAPAEATQPPAEADSPREEFSAP